MAAPQISKRVTLDLDLVSHKKLRNASKSFQLTQQDLLTLIVDLTLGNPEAIRPHAERFRKRKEAEEQRKLDMERKAQDLLSKLTPEQQNKLLSGAIDLERLW